MTYKKGEPRKKQERVILGRLELEDYIIEADKLQFIIKEKNKETGGLGKPRFYTDISAFVRGTGQREQFRALQDISEMKRLYENLAMEVKKMVEFEIKVMREIK